MDLIDIHAHILPGVDDGPADLDETVDTLRTAHQGGTRHVVATSHAFLRSLHTSAERLEEVFAQTTSELERLARERDECAFLSEMTFFLGAENYLSSEFLVALDQDDLVSLGGGGGLLIEFNPYLSFEIMKSALDKVIQRGFTPVLAHVERYRIFHRSGSRLEEVVGMGCQAQINADSILGPFTSPVRRRAIDWLRNGVASVIASDMHNNRSRSSRLGAAAATLERRFDRQLVREWFVDNPRRLLEARRTVDT